MMGGFNAIETGHAYVEKHNIRIELSGQPDGIATVSCFTDDVVVDLVVQ